MDSYFQAHTYLIDHISAPVRRSLMDSIDWSYRLIGIRGARGVGRTQFLLQYAKEHFDPRMRQCLYLNMNSFYFQCKGIVAFAGDFVKAGGQVLIIDQAFKLPRWREQLCECYHRYPKLRIVYSTTAVMGNDNTELSTLSRQYWLHGFSFREFVNLQTGENLRAYTINELIENHEFIQRSILSRVKPWDYFDAYLRHGHYPFFLDTRNFTEALLKAMNIMVEVDILFTKQVELKYLERIKRLLYLLASAENSTPNISLIAEQLGTSRATVMNYLKYLEEARLINMIYREGEQFPKKPAAIYLHDTNLIHAMYIPDISEQQTMETFFINSLWRHHTISKGRRDGQFLVNGTYDICVADKAKRIKHTGRTTIIRYNTEVTRATNEIPLWLFGFLY